MANIPEKDSFQITLQTNDGDNASEYWQIQCKYLYNELYRALPEGSIKPTNFEVSTGERPFDITSFSTILISELAGKFFATIIFEALYHWYENRQEANIIIECPDGSKINIPKELLLKLLKYHSENSNLSICDALNNVKMSNE